VNAHSHLGRAAGDDNRSDTRATVFDRVEERKLLRDRLAQRRSFLLHGPAGVGKTLLLNAVLPDFPDILYSGSNATPQALYRSLAELLLRTGHHVFTSACPKGTASLQAKSAVSLKGLIRQALLNSKYLVALDHLVRPSPALAASIRKLMLNWSVPVVAVTRSAHMEDAGFVLPLFPDRRDKLALRNLDPDVAREFAVTLAQSEDLHAENLTQFLEKVVEYSAGNPGAMLSMIRLAREPRYLHANQIKIAPLYIDYKIATVSQ
jgi:hypothetical protein